MGKKAMRKPRQRVESRCTKQEIPGAIESRSSHRRVCPRDLRKNIALGFIFLAFTIVKE